MTAVRLMAGWSRPLVEITGGYALKAVVRLNAAGEWLLTMPPEYLAVALTADSVLVTDGPRVIFAGWIDQVSTGAADDGSMSWGGSEYVFALVVNGTKHLYAMTYASGTFGTPALLPFSNTTFDDESPRFATDDLTLYFGSKGRAGEGSVSTPGGPGRRGRSSRRRGPRGSRGRGVRR